MLVIFKLYFYCHPDIYNLLIIDSMIESSQNDYALKWNQAWNENRTNVGWKKQLLPAGIRVVLPIYYKISLCLHVLSTATSR